eukprot:COSAG03_NODE_22517_length_290_cov_0.764398_1_plen_87_part_01
MRALQVATLPPLLLQVCVAQMARPMPSRMPRFSWETLPVGWHSSNASGLWADPDIKTLSRYAIVTLEKDQGTDLVVPPATLARKGMY